MACSDCIQHAYAQEKILSNKNSYHCIVLLLSRDKTVSRPRVQRSVKNVVNSDLVSQRSLVDCSAGAISTATTLRSPCGATTMENLRSSSTTTDRS